METKTLQDLFIDMLKDTYDVEHQIAAALPKLAHAAKSIRLTTAFEEHLAETENHIHRLVMVFESQNLEPSRKACKGMQALIAEGAELMKADVPSELMDAGLIAAAQKVEHYEIAAYGTLISYANLLGWDSAAKTLHETIDEEKAIDEKLTHLAENTVNVRAA
ncbi:MAG: ferritin-like domain-containing protein [Chloroflexota bacterium]